MSPNNQLKLLFGFGFAPKYQICIVGGGKAKLWAKSIGGEHAQKETQELKIAEHHTIAQRNGSTA